MTGQKDALAAERYAHALFEVARGAKKDAEIEAELESLGAALKTSPELAKLFNNPYFKASEKRKFLESLYKERIAGVHDTLVDFFSILFEKNRFGLLPEIAENYKRIADEAQGEITVEIRTAAPLSGEAESAIVQKVERFTGSKVAVQKSVDPSLIGGVVLRIKNRVFDGSVKHKIQEIRKELAAARVA